MEKGKGMGERGKGFGARGQERLVTENSAEMVVLFGLVA